MRDVRESVVGIVGLGYVGLPLAIEFGKRFETVGFDIDLASVDELPAGQNHTLETTPEELCEAVCSRCTEEVCVPILERKSGLKFNADFFVGYSLERVNPGDREHHVTTICKVISGSTPEATDFIDRLYASIIAAGTHKAPCIKFAEAAKVIENTQRDLNIALVNDLAILFDKLGIDALDVLEAAGTKWNFPPFRLELVGGYCIGVAPYYLTHKGQEVGHHPDVILAGRRTNDGMGLRYRPSHQADGMQGHQPGECAHPGRGAGVQGKLPGPAQHVRGGHRVRAGGLQRAGGRVRPMGGCRPRRARIRIRPRRLAGARDIRCRRRGHRRFAMLGTEGARAFGKPASVVYDVKCILPREAADDRL